MIKSKANLESVIQNRVGTFSLDNDCPLEIAEQFLIEFTQYIGKVKEQIKASQEAAKQEKTNEPFPQEASKE